MNKYLIVLLTIGIFLYSCKKYEEGPTLSFRSKAKRLSRKWCMKEEVISDSTIFYDLNKERNYIQFHKDGLVNFRSDSISFDGYWHFSHNKERLIIDRNWDSGTNFYTWKIVGLKSKELWLSIPRSNGQNIKTKFEPA